MVVWAGAASVLEEAPSAVLGVAAPAWAELAAWLEVVLGVAPTWAFAEPELPDAELALVEPELPDAELALAELTAPAFSELALALAGVAAPMASFAVRTRLSPGPGRALRWSRLLPGLREERAQSCSWCVDAFVPPYDLDPRTPLAVGTRE